MYYWYCCYSELINIVPCSSSSAFFTSSLAFCLYLYITILLLYNFNVYFPGDYHIYTPKALSNTFTLLLYYSPGQKSYNSIEPCIL